MSPRSPPSPAAADPGPARIVVADGDARSRAAAAGLLAEAGYEAAQVARGEEVLAVLQALAPELLLLDVALPGADAFEVLRRVKGDPALERTSVVILGSAAAGPRRHADLLDAGAEGCIVRPLHDDELLARVRSQLRQHELMRSLRASESTVRSQAELLERNVSLLRMATQLARLGGWTIDLPGRVLTWSDENCAIHDVPPGYRPTLEEGIGYFPPEHREEVIRKVEACARDGTAYEFELPKITAKGRRIWVRSIGEAVRDDQGRIVRLQGAFQDITEWKRNEEALRQKEALLKQVEGRLASTLEHMSDAFYMLDSAWRFEYLNAEAGKLLRRRREQLLGQVIWEAFPGLEATALHGEFHAAVREGRPAQLELLYPPLEDWFEISAYPAPGGLAVYFRVVTGRKLAEAALRESERELRSLAESMPQMVWMAGRDGGNIYFNQRWVEYTGLTLKDSHGSGWARPMHPDDRKRVWAAWQRATSGGGDYNQECRLRRADGAYRWMLVRGLPFRDERGRILKWMGTLTDIDDLKRAEESVRQSEERFRLLSRATNDAIWDWDLLTDALWWNEGFEALFGFRREDVEPTIASWTTRIHPEDRERIVSEVHGAIDGGREIWSGSYRFRRSDGTYARVHDRGHVIRDAEGRATRMVGGMSDVTERLALEEQLRQAQRLDSLGQLTGGVAHDFNNLLTVILGNAEILAEELAADPQLAPLAQMVLSAADRGAELTQRLLAFARRQPLAPRPVDIGRLAAGLDPLLRRTLGEHIEIGFVRGAGLWPALVDPAQLENALLNLCINARDAMAGGGRLGIEAANVRIAPEFASQHPELAPGEYVMLSVSDTGAGIAPEHLGRVFEPFFTTKAKGKGTGLGLPMVYGFAKQSGGHVSLDSEPGRGTTVRLYLPRAGAAADDDPLAARRLEPGATSETVLLVEDEEAVRASARGHLASLGYRVIEARDGQQALEILQGGARIDLLFTDVVMPGMSGRELADEALKLDPGLKVLYTSGYAEDAIVHHGRLDPGVELLVKPYRRHELARKLRAILDPA